MRSEREIAERVRQACFDAAVQAAEDAGISGLCADGRLEAALDAIRSLPLDALGAPERATGPAAESADESRGPG